jgi:hypothetical protein
MDGRRSVTVRIWACAWSILASRATVNASAPVLRMMRLGSKLLKNAWREASHFIRSYGTATFWYGGSSATG